MKSYYKKLFLFALTIIEAAQFPIYAGEKMVQRDSTMRNGPGAYYEIVTNVPAKATVETFGEENNWVNSSWKRAKGWLPSSAFTKPKGGIDYSGLLESGEAVTVSSVDIAAATKGIISAKFREKYNIDIATADKLDSVTPNAQLVNLILSQLRQSKTAGIVSRLPQRTFQNNVILRQDAESLLGKTLTAYMATNGLITSGKIIEYLNAVAAVVGASSGRYDLSYKVGLLPDKSVNGFGLPGGYVLISMGLLEQLQDEAELACVLAHEIAHSALYHGLREFSKRSKQRRADAVFDELEEISGGSADEEIEADLEKLTKTAYLKVIGGRAREDEMEADLYGTAFAAEAGYDPSAMIDVLVRVNNVTGSGGDVFRHHPPIAERIETLQSAIKKYKMATSSKQRFASRFSEYAEQGLNTAEK